MISNAAESHTFKWATESLDLVFAVNEEGVVCMRGITAHDIEQQPSASELFKDHDLPLTSIRLAGEGNTGVKTAKALVGSYQSARLKYQNHETGHDSQKDTLDIVSYDASTKIEVTVHLVVYTGIPVLRASASVINKSESTVTLTQLSSLTIGGLTSSSKNWYRDYSIFLATNGWFREAQWREYGLPEVGIDENGIGGLPGGHAASQATYRLSNHGSFSTGSHLPMGLLKRTDDGQSWLWQIEHNGSWRWEIGDYKDSVYLAAGGPTAVDHDWKMRLSPGASFKSVPVACAYVNAGLDDAFAALTTYRRAIMRPHEDNDRLPIVFNDYMNCLMGDPDETKIEALLEPVADSGAEFFVIDAGWYSDDSNWWDDVGLWEPSRKRFPSGFKTLLDKIRSKGLTPGLWLEPEVVGIRSVIGKRLPDDAFFQEDGKRIIERGRFQLDYRHPEVRKWMNSVIRGLVVDYGVGYFKFDYNIEVLQGTDVNTSSSGAAHLEHQRAYLSWVQELLDRYPGLVIENCSSGAQRMDYAMLSIHSLQSTSDQQSPELYAAIAAAVPTAVVPEQSATWAYPQAQWDDEINALTVTNSLLGRIYLSGRLDQLNPEQFRLICEGMRVYKEIRQDLKHATPIWPLGLPKWHDEWICMGMRTRSNGIYLSVWRRGGKTEISVPLKNLPDHRTVTARLLYPAQLQAKTRWDAAVQALHIEMPDSICARLFHIST